MKQNFENNFNNNICDNLNNTLNISGIGEFNVLDFSKDNIEICKLVEDIISEKTMIPNHLLDKVTLILRNLFKFLCINLLQQSKEKIEFEVRMQHIKPIYRDVMMAIIREIPRAKDNDLEIELTETCFETQEKLFQILVRVKVPVLINGLIKAIYTSEITMNINRKYNTIRLLFKTINYKYYDRTKFIRAYVCNKDYFIDDSTTKNTLVQEGCFNDQLKMEENDNEWFEVEDSDLSIGELKNIFNTLIYHDQPPNIVQQTQKIKKSKGFCFKQSYKTGKTYKCNTCKNTEELPIQRIYFEDKGHKLCKINFCLTCFDKYTADKESWYLCFICKRYLVNFGKLSIVKGGKPKKVWEETDIHLLEA